MCAEESPKATTNSTPHFPFLHLLTLHTLAVHFAMPQKLVPQIPVLRFRRSRYTLTALCDPCRGRRPHRSADIVSRLNLRRSSRRMMAPRSPNDITNPRVRRTATANDASELYSFCTRLCVPALPGRAATPHVASPPSPAYSGDRSPKTFSFPRCRVKFGYSSFK